MATLAKSFTTEVTAVGLLSSVNPAVNVESTSQAKGFTTDVTAVGLFSSVDHHVLLEATGQGKALPTRVAVMFVHYSGLSLFSVWSLWILSCI